MATIPKEKTMEEVSFIKFQDQLILQSIYCKKMGFIDTGVDFIINVPQERTVLSEGVPTFVSVGDKYNRMIYGQIKSSQKKKYFKERKSAKFQFKVKHIKAWKESNLPVIVVLADLRNIHKPIIYWEEIPENFEISAKKKQIIFLTKIIGENTWDEFDEIIRKFNQTRELGLIIEKDPKVIEFVSEIEIYEQISLLPEFTEFKQKRQEWEDLKKRKIFREFNPIEWNEELETEKPQIGYRILVPKNEYAMFKDPRITPVYSIISEQIVENVFHIEEGKIFYDLLNYTKKRKIKETYKTFEEMENIFQDFKDPLFLFSHKNMADMNFFEKYGKKIISNLMEGDEIDYDKAILTIGESTVTAVCITNNIQWENVDKKLPMIKAMMIDRDKVVYRVKKELELEWRIPLRQTIVWNRTLEKEEKDPHNFDFRCLTLGEVKYDGTLIVWWFKEEKEMRRIDKIEKLTKKEKLEE